MMNRVDSKSGKSVRNNRFTNWWKNYYVYVVSSLVILFMIAVVFCVKGYWPFGDTVLIDGDFVTQAWPNTVELNHKLLSRDSLLYTWHLGFGMNFFSIFAFGYSNPNTLLYLFLPDNVLMQAVTIMYILTLLLTNGSMLYFISHRPYHALPQNQLSNMLFSLAYTFSAYLISNINNRSMSFCAMFFPLIILGLERFVANKGWKLYFVTLLLSFVYNYYFSGLFCIFIILYYFTLQFESFKVFAVKSLKIMAISICSIAISCWYLLPTSINIADNTYTTSSYSVATWYTSFFDIFKNFFAFQTAIYRGSTASSYGEVSLYYGLLPLFLTSFYFLNPHIKRSVRIRKLLLVVLYVFAFNLNGLNYIMHLAHYPTWFPNRFSLFFTLYCIILACESWKSLSDLKYKNVTISKVSVIGIVWIAMSLLCLTFANEAGYGFTYTYSIILIVIYMVVMFLLPLLKGKGAAILAIIGCIEISLNFGYDYVFKVANQSMSGLTERYTDVREILDSEELYENMGFSRMLEERDMVSAKNGGALFGFNSPSVFSSSIGNIGYYLNNFGVHVGSNVIYTSVYNPATLSMLGIQYVMTDRKVQEQKTKDMYSSCLSEYNYLDVILDENDIVIYENDKVLSLGYMIDSNGKDFYEKLLNGEVTTETVGDNINMWLKSVCGVDDIMKPYDLQASYINTFNCYARLDGQTFYVSRDRDTFELNETEKKGEYLEDDGEGTPYDSGIDSTIIFRYVATEPGIYYAETLGTMTALGYVEEGEEMQVFYRIDRNDLEQYGMGSGKITLYKFDESQWEKAYNVLEQQQLQVTDYSSTEIHGTIEVEQDGLLFTSIPYDDNWRLYVDGEEQEIIPLWNSSFIAVELPEGVHSIHFEYKQKGIIEGIGLSSVALLIAIGFFIFSKKGGRDILLEKELKRPECLETFYSKKEMKVKKKMKKRKMDERVGEVINGTGMTDDGVTRGGENEEI